MIATPLFVVFGRLSDRIGRLKIILAGCGIAAVGYLPLFHGLTHYANPALEEFRGPHRDHWSRRATVRPTCSCSRARCSRRCDKAQDYLTKAGLSFEAVPPVEGQDVVVHIGATELRGWDDKAYPAALAKAELSRRRRGPARINYPMVLLLLVVLVLLVTMVYGPIAAYLVELFPAKIRYTSMSLPYHIGNGWFGGMLPLVATAMVAASGNIYRGLWYPIAVAAFTLLVGVVFLRERPRDFDIHA